jgi:murein L,D-transpeptidase YcbB/YkuD
MPKVLALGFAILISLSPIACGQPGPSGAAVTRSIQTRVASAVPTGSLAGERLIEPKAVGRFYKARKSTIAWNHDDVPKIVEAIKGVYADGLDPDDYHLAAIEKLNEQRKHATTAEAEADLDLLLSDAIAAVVDHVRYGKVHPSALDPRWNVDPRDDMPPLDQTLDDVARSKDPVRAIETARPDHFVYRGLMGALAQLREIEAKGGWGTVPPGRAIKPGSSDPRVPRLRSRLAKSGELDPAASADSTRGYDHALVDAVKLFQARHRLPETGVVDRKTIDALNVSPAARAAQVRVNLERARWVLGGLKEDFVLVNLPAFKAYYIEGGKNVWEGRTQIGDEAKQTPTFRARMQTVVLNPDWTVPKSIVTEEIFPDIQAGKDGLASRKLKVYDAKGDEVDPKSVDWGDPDHFPYTLKQPAGPDNALGQVKLLFPNKYSIYLHDTPSKHLFESTNRTFSHGCIRTENVLQLAEILLHGQDGWDHAKIEQTLASGETQNIALERKPYVLIVYWTVTVGASGEVRYADDVYNLDQPLLNALSSGRKAV